MAAFEVATEGDVFCDLLGCLVRTDANGWTLDVVAKVNVFREITG